MVTRHDRSRAACDCCQSGSMWSLALWLIAIMLLCGCSANKWGLAGAGQPEAVSHNAPSAPSPYQLEAALAREFERLGLDPAKAVAQAPTGKLSQVVDLAAITANMQPPFTVQLSWTEMMCGDYDQNATVGISDVTQLGIHWGKSVLWTDGKPAGDPGDDGGAGPLQPPAAGSGAEYWRLARIDGNGDGVLNIQDLTPIAQHWKQQLSLYYIYRRAQGADEWALWYQFALRPEIAPARPVRYSAALTEAAPGTYEYKVVPYDALSDTTGPDSNIVSVQLESDTPVPPAAHPWPMFGHDPQHTHRSPFVGSQAGKLKWIFKAGGDATGLNFSKYNQVATGLAGQVYAARNENTILEAFTSEGLLLWQYITGEVITRQPVAGPGGDVYLILDDNRLLALNSSGIARWEHVLAGAVNSHPVFDDAGRIYASTAEGSIYCFNSDGTMAWIFGLGRTATTGVQVSGEGASCIVAEDNMLYMLTSDGAIDWTYALADNVVGLPVIGQDGTVFLVSITGIVYAINSAGVLAWNYQFAFEVSCEYGPILGGTENLYINIDRMGSRAFFAFYQSGIFRWNQQGCALACDKDGNVYAGTSNLTLYTPAKVELWTVELNCASPEPSTVSSDHIGVVLISYGSLYVFASDGNSRWRRHYTNEFAASPIVDANNMVYIGNSNGCAYAINPSGLMQWTKATSDGIRSSFALDSDGYLYNCQFESTFSLAKDGSVRWLQSRNFQYDFNVILSTDKELVVNTSSSIDRLNNAGGLEMSIALTGLEGMSTGSLSVGADDSIYSIISNKLYAYSADGALKWVNEVHNSGSNPAIGSDNEIYVTGGSCLSAIDSDGNIKWTFNPADYGYDGSGWESGPAIAADGTVHYTIYEYMSPGASRHYAVNPDGTLKWRFSGQAAVGWSWASTPAVGADGCVYYGSCDGKIYAVDADGSLKWSYATGGGIQSSPAIGADGAVYVGSMNGSLYAFAD